MRVSQDQGSRSGRWRVGVTSRVGRPAMVAGVVLLGLIGTLTPWFTQTASAGLYGPVPANFSEDPTDEFVDNEPIFTYVRSDVAGGAICVVKADVALPTCDGAGVYPKKHLVGIGTLFSLVEAGPLVPGLFRLLVENSLGDPLEVSDVFTVSPCTVGCDKRLGADELARIKATAADMNFRMDGMCSLSGVLEKVAGKATAMRGYSETIKIKHPTFTPVDLNFVTVPVPSGSGVWELEIVDPATAGINKALEILKDLSCQTAKMYKDIKEDPPDPNFGQVVTPELSTIPAQTPTSYDQLVREIDRQRAWGDAEFHALERYQGAVAAGSVPGQIRQATALGDGATTMASSLRAGATRLRAWAASAATDPQLSGVLLTTAQRSSLASLYARVTANGFTAGEINQFHSLGYADADIAAIRTHFAQDISAVPVDQSYSELLNTLATDFESNIAGMQDFARNAYVIAGRLGTVTANLTPVATFTATPTSGQAPLAVSFDGSASSDTDGSIATYAWDFGDGATSTGATVNHTYSTVASRTATLTVTDNQGATASAVRAITVSAPGSHTPPIAVAAATTPTAGVAPLTVSFTGAGSSDAQGPIASYAWDFGDGATATGPTPQHTYTSTATFTATLTVTDGDGQTASSLVTVNVGTLPVASFTRTPAGGAPPVTVSFDASGSSSAGVLSYAWQFGDGAAATGITATHTYAAIGQYIARLTVTDGIGLSASTTRLVSVKVGNQAPLVNAGPDISTGESSRSVNFVGLADDVDGTIVTYHWNFGDGEVSDLANPNHAYATKGTFVATLTATDDQGLSNSDTTTVTITNENPVISGLNIPTRVAPGAVRPIVASAYDFGLDSLTATWDFGDGTPLTSVDPTIPFEHAWANTGIYLVTVTVTDGHGGTAIASGSVVVTANTVSAGPDRSGSEGEQLTFVRPLDGVQDRNSTITWDFGDGSQAFDPAGDNAAPVTHIYRNNGTFTLRLTSNDGNTTVADAAIITITNVAPTITGVATSGGLAPGSPASMHAYVSDVGLDDVLTTTWNFGDGATGTGAVISHIYASAGTYGVLTTVTDDFGASTSAARQVIVGSNATGAAIDSRGRDFWLDFNLNYTGGNAPILYVTSETATSGTVEVPGLGVSLPFSVAANSITSVVLPSTVSLSSPAVEALIEARAIHVVADNDVTVYGLNQISFTTDAYLGLPTRSLGTDYRVMSYGGGGGPEASVVATANHTTVTVTPTVDMSNHPAGQPFTTLLDIGDVWNLPRTEFDPTGSRIQADHPVSVFTGNSCANVPVGAGYCDHIVEQLTPTSAWGRRFVTTPLASRQNGDTFRVLAATDGTIVKINGSTVATLAAGAYYEQLLITSSVIDSSSPIQVAQYANGSSFSGEPGDPFMMLVPPYEQFLSSYTVAAPSDGFEQSYINVTAPGSGIGITLDGAAIPAASFAAIGTSGYSAAALPVAPGTHRLVGSQPFGVAIYGFNNDDSYGYIGGLSLSSVASVIRVTVSPRTGSALVGATACATGRATDAADQPVSGVRMDFVGTGVNPTSGFRTTDASGNAQYCFDGAVVGVDTITATVSGISDSATRTWTSEVTPPVNRAPTATGQSVSTPEDTALPVVLGGVDPDGDVLTLAVGVGPSHGSLSGSGANLIYTPAPNFNGADSFTFTTNDGKVSSAEASVSISVTPVNDAPVATAQSLTTVQGAALSILLAGGDPDGDALTFAVRVGPAHGSLSGTAANPLYTPAAGYGGADSFTFVANDGKTDSGAATVSILVTPSSVCRTPAPTVDVSVSADQRTASNRVVSPTFSTGSAGELLIATVEADGPSAPNQVISRVTGGNLAWTLVARSNLTYGTTEVWQAFASARLSAASVTARFAKVGFDGSITVAAFAPGARIGSSAVASGISAAPTVALAGRGCNSMVWVAGHDWSHAKDPLLQPDQTLVHKFVDRRVADSYWVQTVAGPTTAGQTVTARASLGAKDRWTLTAVEVIGE